MIEISKNSWHYKFSKKTGFLPEDDIQLTICQYIWCLIKTFVYTILGIIAIGWVIFVTSRVVYHSIKILITIPYSKINFGAPPFPLIYLLLIIALIITTVSIYTARTEDRDNIKKWTFFTLIGAYIVDKKNKVCSLVKFV